MKDKDKDHRIEILENRENLHKELAYEKCMRKISEFRVEQLVRDNGILNKENERLRKENEKLVLVNRELISINKEKHDNRYKS